jgi:transposase
MTAMTRTQDDSETLYVALELSSKTWKLAFGKDLRAPRIRTITAGDMTAFCWEVEEAKRKLGLAQSAAVLCCYEAGRDGFWLHRWLVAHGFQNLVIDPASIEVDRRRRRRKTDRLDATKLLMRLVRHAWGDRAWSVVRVPTAEMEDRRRCIRERERLVKERTQHRARIRGLLATQGMVVKRMDETVLEARGPEGEALPSRLAAEVRRELARMQLLAEQLRELEAALEREGERGDIVSQRAQLLTKLKAVGLVASRVLAFEFLWRDFRNPRQVGGAVGLTGTPHQSGDMARDQGVSKAGNRRVRAVILEVTWLWLRYQPDSKLSRWFQQRFGEAKGRMRRAGIVALARRLLIALWRFAVDGVVPEGAILRAA